MRRATLPLLIALLLPALAPAKVPTLLNRYSNLPCLAPIIRQVDPNAPKSVEEAFLLPPYQEATLLDRIGTANFPITTPSPEAQQFFNQGIALLHSFWYSEAERSFRQALTFDETSPMIYWGLALANERAPNRASLYLRRAIYEAARRPDVSPLERQWIDITADFFAAEEDNLEKTFTREQDIARRHTRIARLEALALANPENVEARAFLLRHLVLDEARAGLPITSHFTADLLAESIHNAHPDHPSRHYRNLLWLAANPVHAAANAWQGPAITPLIPDAWRYSAQAYLSAGDMATAIEHQEASLRAAHANMQRTLAMPDETENLAANYGAYIDTLCSAGRLEEALAAARRMIALPRAASLSKSITSVQIETSCHTAGRQLLAQTLIRFERWEDLLADTDPDTGILAFTPNSPVTETSSSIYWRALAHLNLDQEGQSLALLTDLDALHRKSLNLEGASANTETIQHQLESLRTYSALFTKTLPTLPALEDLSLADISPDHLSHLLFEAGFADTALAIATTDLENRPSQFLSTANYCDLHFRAGEKDKALVAFDNAFRRNAASANPGLAAFQRLRPIADARGFRSNWRLSTNKPTNPEIQLDPVTLGPLAWEPPKAPDWSLPDHTGNAISLSDYEGKPVLVVFFLGVGCVYCAEQLEIFRPALPSYEEAGIDIIAISTDRREILAGTSGAAPGDAPPEKAPAEHWPFPILADPELTAFKAYGAFSSLEKKGMHGTLLIGPKGNLLWRDTGHEPFLLPEFLLEESQRLLAIDAGDQK